MDVFSPAGLVQATCLCLLRFPSARFLEVARGSQPPILTEAARETGGTRRPETVRGHPSGPSSICAYTSPETPHAAAKTETEPPLPSS